MTKTFQRGNHTITALVDINLAVAAGEMLAIVGPSGSGKSTLMHMLGLLDQCTHGRYFLAGQDVAQLSPPARAAMRNRNIGFVFQSFFLLERMNVLQNVILPLLYRGTERKAAHQKALTMLDKIGIADLALAKPSQLSGGQQQRVAIARALVGDPDLILADEPTGSLDVATGSDMLSLLRELNRTEGRTIIVITHDLAMSRHFNRVVTIKDGVLVC